MNKKVATQYDPDYASPPGETLQEALEERGMSQAEFSDLTGLSKKTISNIIKGIDGISSDAAMEFEKVLDIPARFWLALEKNYRERLIRIAGKQKMPGLHCR
jgi:HTH-type transcriptional regulator / antitoxin HigA